MVMLVIFILGAATLLISSFNPSAVKNARQEDAATALLQARNALISFAMTHGDTHPTPPAAPNHVHGYLPCPDINGNLGSNSEGSSETCGSKDENTIGKLPWKSLRLPPLRDGDGECLWYAVSGTYKNNPKTSLMNWDTSGLFEVLNADGVAVAQNVVAVIFSPGAVLGAQNRAADSNAPICGGNYTKTNYLDNDTIHNIDNMNIATGKFILPHEHRDANGNIILTSNDQITFITQQDIWNAIKKRNDFDNFVASLLNDAIDCAAEPVTLDFNGTTLTETSGVPVSNFEIGRVPKSCLTPTLNENWQDNLLYAKCTSGNCLNVNGTGCNGVVIFPGERNTSQARNTNTQKNTWSNYLEDTPSAANLTTFTTGSTPFAGTPSFSGATVYLGAFPSTDIFACILPPSPSPSPSP